MENQIKFNPYIVPGLSNKTVTNQLLYLSRGRDKLLIDNITDSVILVLNKHFGTKVTRSEVMDKTRRREIVQVRQCIMYYAKQRTKMSLKAIGNHLGGRDHSTVIHGVQAWSDIISYDKYYIRANAMVMDKLEWMENVIEKNN